MRCANKIDGKHVLRQIPFFYIMITFLILGGCELSDRDRIPRGKFRCSNESSYKVTLNVKNAAITSVHDNWHETYVLAPGTRKDVRGAFGLDFDEMYDWQPRNVVLMSQVADNRVVFTDR